MKPKQLAQELKISDVEVLRLAIQVGIVSPGFKTLLSDGQVKAIKEQFAKNSTHQLSPAVEQVPEVPLEETESAIEAPKSAIEQVPEQGLTAPEKPELGIAEQKQTALSHAMGASEQQQAHILETELQQAADDGVRRGVVKELIRATKELETAMLVRNAVFHKNQKSRDRLNGLLADSAGDDFLTDSRLSSQTFMQTAEVGAATDLDAHQALKNLGINL